MNEANWYKKGRFIFILVIALGLISTACSPQANGSPDVEEQITQQAALMAEPVQTAPPAGLGGITWQWMGTQFSDDRSVNPPDPSVFTLRFLDDGQISGEADCNTYGGTYAVQENMLVIQAVEMTRMVCQPGSLADEYIRQINQTNAYLLQNGDLVLIMSMDSGSIFFSPQPVAVLPVPAEGAPSGQAKANVNIRSGPGTDYPVYSVMPRNARTEITGVSQDGKWWVIKFPLAPLEQGWVSGDYLTVQNTAGLPSITTPTLVPTAPSYTPQPGEPQITALQSDYVRVGPGEQYPAVGIAPAGAEALVIGKSQDGTWWAFRINPNILATGYGWISSTWSQVQDAENVPVIQPPLIPPTTQFPTPPVGSPMVVATVAIHVRSGPDTAYPSLEVAPAGTFLEVLGKTNDGGWYQVVVPASVSNIGTAWVSVPYTYPLYTVNIPIVDSSMPVPIGDLPGQIENPQCALISQSPQDYTLFKPGVDFDMVWVVQNIGSTAWEQSEYDLRLIYMTPNGQIHRGTDTYDLTSTVMPGQTYQVVLDAVSPQSAGVYAEAWEIAMAKNVVCRFFMVIEVKP